MNRIFLKTCCLFVFVVLYSGHAFAHKVTVFAWVEGNMVLGESKFSGGRKAQGAEIVVWDTDGNELLRTQTDENGEFSFPIPKKTGMRIELIAGMGHRGEWTIPMEELGEDIASGNGSDDSAGKVDSDGTSVAEASSQDENKTVQQTVENKIEQRTSENRMEQRAAENRMEQRTDENIKKERAALSYLDEAELESIVERSVEKVLDRKMKPLMRTMANLEQKGPTVNEIVGGIGYIFGLMGVVLYFKSRQKKRDVVKKNTVM